MKNTNIDFLNEKYSESPINEPVIHEEKENENVNIVFEKLKYQSDESNFSIVSPNFLKPLVPEHTYLNNVGTQTSTLFLNTLNKSIEKNTSQ